MELMLILSLVSFGLAVDKASFYGASYIAYPLHEAKGASDITFRFRTHLSDALLLLAAGKTDYCMIRLEKGRLKLNINLGAGESELFSPTNTLNDSEWHQVNIVRREANLTMKIDDSIVKKRLPGRFFELNIHFGIFLGGQGHFSELFLGHMENFRGCMEDVYYNGVKILEKARSRSGSVTVEGVTWSCSPEFDAGADTHISFVDEGAYMLLPKINSRAGTRWRVEVKTLATRGVVVYNAGGARGDFLALELWGGRASARTRATSLAHPALVADGRWHTLTLLYNPALLEVSVDGVAVSARLEGGARHLDLADAFYVGGIEPDKRPRAAAKGLKAADSSLLGCMKPAEVSGRAVGLRAAAVTRGVSAGCVWHYPCAGAVPPCRAAAACRQRGLRHFTCDCDQDLCLNPDYADDYKVFSKWSDSLELVSVAALCVREGGVAPVSARALQLALDHHKYGVRAAGVLFHVHTPPAHGRLALELSRAPPDRRPTFTLQDLARDRVRYVHDGSEAAADACVLELELQPERAFTLPAYLQGRHPFVLHVNVTPANDAPAITVAPALTLTQGGRVALNTSVLRVEDPDTPPEELIYSLLTPDTELAGSEVQVRGTAARSFTARDVTDGAVWLMHTPAAAQHNHSSFKLAFQVSDGSESSGVGTVRVAVQPLALAAARNTGLQLPRRAHALVTPDNLTFTTNDPLRRTPVRFDIVKPPQSGVVEAFREADGAWHAVDSFTSDAVERQHVRYTHLLGAPQHDHFQFRASVEGARAALHDFRLTFVELQLFRAAAEDVALDEAREAVIAPRHLRHATRPLALPPARLGYTLDRAPLYGELRLAGAPLPPAGAFTQLDVDELRLRYRAHRRAYTRLRDEFTFTVAADDCAPLSGAVALHLAHAAPAPAAPRLQVAEGGRAPLPSDALSARPAAVGALEFRVTRAPRHGRLQVVDGEGRVTAEGATRFTLAELQAGRVYYAHDDSEAAHDALHYVALSAEADDYQAAGTLHVDVVARNDNGPARAHGRVFRVAVGGARLVTAADLRYTDADRDTPPAALVYSLQRAGAEPPNGVLVRADDPAAPPLAHFSQDDIDQHRVLFQHSGPERGRISFWVSDGLFDVNGHLDVEASPPFVRLCATNGSVVERGESVVITQEDLQVDTNMNCLEEDVRYEVTAAPAHGQLSLGEEAARAFTQLDVAARRLAYTHRHHHAHTDQFSLKVTCLETWGEGVYPVRVLPPSYWQPLVVAARRPLLVEESTSVNVTRDVLEVMHPEIEPTDIVYTVVVPPKHGWLEIAPLEGDESADAEAGPVTSFTQATVNDRRLVYVQAGVNRSADTVRLDVTNGIVWLRGLELAVIIVPEHFYMSADVVSVEEGAAAPLTPALFRADTPYYRGRVLSYRVVQKPRHGRIALLDQDLDLLPVLKLNSGDIKYVHDGSEKAQDSFTLVAVADSGKTSAAFAVAVAVAAVNDEPPIVAANTGLCVWQGGVATLTRNELHVNDIDTPLENVTIIVSDIVSGYMAFKDAPESPVHRFTQADIDRGRVIFVHTNGTKGKMIFNVTDGLHELSTITFLISTKPVSLKMVRKQKLVVFPLMRGPLTDAILAVKCSDPGRDVAYSVQRPPALGRLLLIDGDAYHRSPERFTQRDVDRARLYYEHTHPFSDLHANDSFVFAAEAAFAPALAGQVFHIDISVSAGGLARYVHAAPVRVREGGGAPVAVNVSAVLAYLESAAGVRQPRLEAQWAAPRHGRLQPPLAALTRAQLESGAVRYEHDDSDTTRDAIDMALFLLPDYVLLCNLTVPIEIAPVNDQPFRLLTDTPQIQVVQGENYTITRADLLTEDADTAAADIVYDVISGPTAGRMVVVGRDPPADRAPSAASFTQEDVDRGRLVYEHSGALQTVTFYFRVWDGQFKPTYTVFTIDVAPVILNATASHPVLLQQGSNVATLTTDQIYIETNAQKTNVRYDVTRQPTYGTIYVGRDTVERFSHKDLMEKVVIYMQNDMTAANDSFELIASLAHGNATSPFTIDVKVQPLMSLADLRVEAEKTRITLGVMDASGLATLTVSDPVYTLLRKPKHGVLKKIIRSSGERTSAREREVAAFTHEEVKAGVIYYVADNRSLAISGLEDGFRFLLASTMFQPAAGGVRVLIGNRQKKNLPGPNDPESHEGVPVLGGDSGWYYLRVALGAGGVVGAALCAAGALRLRRWAGGARHKALAAAGGVAPIPLPRPPDHLMPDPAHHTPSIKRYVSSEQSVATGASTPPGGGGVGVKVTPLGDHARYPYGTDDHTDGDEWSSYDASEAAYPARAANPMLRRNQYWV